MSNQKTSTKSSKVSVKADKKPLAKGKSRSKPAVETLANATGLTAEMASLAPATSPTPAAVHTTMFDFAPEAERAPSLESHFDNDAKASVAAATATSPSNESRPSASRDAIARRAFQLFVARGGTAGRHLEDWLEAERQLQSA